MNLVQSVRGKTPMVRFEGLTDKESARGARGLRREPALCAEAERTPEEAETLATGSRITETADRSVHSSCP